MISNFTVCVYSENSPGVLHRITVMFTRRKTNIESLTVSETERTGISRFTIVVKADGDSIGKIARQLRRIIDVHEVVVSRDSDLVVAEVALIKVKKNNSPEFNEALHHHELAVVYENGETISLQKTGSEHDIDQALHAMQPFVVVEFVRSGRIAMKRSGAGTGDFLDRDQSLPEETSYI